MNSNFIYGADIGSLLGLEAKGITFKNHQGKVKDLFLILKEAGFASIRLRLWVDPETNEGLPYGGGNNNLQNTLVLAKRAQNAGLKLVLDFHYSDFWADPGKQFLPKAWQNLCLSTLSDKVYLYTKSVLQTFKKNRINLDYVQVGNEITNGMLWPVGRLYKDETLLEDGFMNLSTLLNSGIKGVNEVYPKAKTILHLDRGGDQKMYEHFFQNMVPLLLPFDVIGLSYYPYWHGTMRDLKNNILNLQKKFKQEIMIMETSYAYCGQEEKEPYVVTEVKTPAPQGFPPFTLEGQAQYLFALITLAAETNIAGVYYWEPAWLVAEGDTWATKEGRTYIQETDKKDGNEWANQALFNNDGEPLPALNVYNKFKEERNL